MLDVTAVAKRVVQTYKGTSEAALEAKCDAWFLTDVLPHVCEKGRVAVKAHLEKGDIVAIVTGATLYATAPLARLLHIPHIVTSRVEVEDGILTGRVVEPLCFGHGKLARAQALAKELDFSLEESVFYTDSITDLPLLSAVGERICINPDPRLRRLARARGWAIERW